MKGEDIMAIYYVPTVPSSILGSKKNPIYSNSINSSYQKHFSLANYSILDYHSACKDFRTLFYALTNEAPVLTSAENHRLQHEFPDNSVFSKIDCSAKNKINQSNSTTSSDS